MLLWVILIVLGVGVLWATILCLRPMTVAWTFDDGIRAHAEIVGPMLKKYGWTGAFNVCTDFLDSNPTTLTAEKRKILGLVEHPEARMNWDDARRLLADGHEVYPHGCTHENLEERWKAGEYDLVKHEIRDSIASYREHIGILPRFFCCPHLGWTPEVRDLIRAEGVEMFNNWRPGFGGEEAAEAVVKTLGRLYYEGRRHVDLMFHGIVSREGGHKPFADESVFEEILKAVRDFEKSGKIRVVAYRAAHFGPSRFTRLVERVEWLLKKIRRVVFCLIVENRNKKMKVGRRRGRGGVSASARKKRRFTLSREQLAAFEAADPNLEFKPLTEETAEDFKKVVRARFSPGTERQVDVLLANPLRKYCSSVGDIAYEMGEPACVQGAMLRRVYYKQTPYLMLNGSMFAKMPNASPVSVFGIMWRTDYPRSEVKFSFCNTAVKASCDIGGALQLPCRGVDGPNSWRDQRVALICPLQALWMRFQAIHPRLPTFHWPDWHLSQAPYLRHLRDGRCVSRCNEIDDAHFGPLWERLLFANDGLLSSRSPEFLRWMFDRRLKEGKMVMLTLNEHTGLSGYIIFRGRDAAGKCWSVIDMIAIDNDTDRLLILMREAVRYLRRQTPAVELSIAGFPSWVQPLIAKVFRYQVTREHNSSSFALYDEKLEDLFSIVDSRAGWFCGPADGDAWL